MTWNAKWRYPKPPGWDSTRKRILKRDRGVCYLCGQVGADNVDHIVPVSAGGSHRDQNLAAIHEIPCHRYKTSQQTNRAKPEQVSKKREPEQHPGIYPPP